MGSKQSKKPILMLGLPDAGKTSILYKLKLGEVKETIPTVGFCVETVEYNNISLTIYDLGGQEKLAPLWRHYFVGTVGVILVVDGADSAKLQDARREIHKVLKDPALTPACVMLMVNKSDLPEAPSDISSIHNTIFDSELDFKVPHASFATSMMDDDSLQTALSHFATMLEKGTKPEQPFYSRVFQKISGFFTQPAVAPTQTEPSSNAAALTSSADDLSRIPSDDALQNNTTFLRAFEQCILPIHQWTHRSHLRVAWLYLRLHWPDQQKAQEAIIAGIQRYNMEYSRHKPLQTGFHLTMTIFWITIIRNALLRDERSHELSKSQGIEGQLPVLTSFEKFCERHAELTDSRLFQKYYTREVLFTDKAKTTWTSPNLESLPLDPIVSSLPDTFVEVKSQPDKPRPDSLRNYTPTQFEIPLVAVSVPAENCST